MKKKAKEEKTKYREISIRVLLFLLDGGVCSVVLLCFVSFGYGIPLVDRST